MSVVSALDHFATLLAFLLHRIPLTMDATKLSNFSNRQAKLLARIVAPDMENLGGEKYNDRGLYDHTYGITSDPITQFAVVLSALVHDTGKGLETK